MKRGIGIFLVVLGVAWALAGSGAVGAGFRASSDHERNVAREIATVEKAADFELAQAAKALAELEETQSAAVKDADAARAERDAKLEGARAAVAAAHAARGANLASSTETLANGRPKARWAGPLIACVLGLLLLATGALLATSAPPRPTRQAVPASDDNSETLVATKPPPDAVPAAMDGATTVEAPETPLPQQLTA